MEAIKELRQTIFPGIGPQRKCSSGLLSSRSRTTRLAAVVPSLAGTMCQGSLLRTQGLATSRDIKYFLSYCKVDSRFLAWRNDSSWERHAPCPLAVPHKVFLASHTSQLDHLGDIYQWIFLSRGQTSKRTHRSCSGISCYNRASAFLLWGSASLM